MDFEKKFEHFKGHSTSTLRTVFVLLIFRGTFEEERFFGGTKMSFQDDR